jgi:hypothetical protein
MPFQDWESKQPQVNPETRADKARREVSLIGEGLSGFTDAAGDAFHNRKLETVGKFALSVGVGLGLAYLSRGYGIGKLATRVLGTAAGVSFMSDVARNGSQIFSSLVDNWHSDSNWVHNRAVMRNHLGRFGFDTLVTSAGGIIGGGIGHHAFRPKIPAELMTQMHATGIRGDYYNKVMVADQRANVIRNADGKFSAEKVSRANEQFPGALKDVVTYRQYWQGEIAQLKTGGHRGLDEVGIMRYFVDSRPQAQRLDRLTTELQSLGNTDLATQKLLEQATPRLIEINKLIYGTTRNQ